MKKTFLVKCTYLNVGGSYADDVAIRMVRGHLTKLEDSWNEPSTCTTRCIGPNVVPEPSRGLTTQSLSHVDGEELKTRNTLTAR
jgi:hypothetical protein